MSVLSLFLSAFFLVHLFSHCSSFSQPDPAGGFNEYPDCFSGPLSKFPICNASLPFSQRASSLISMLNTTEKIIRIGQAYGSNAVDRIGLPNFHFRQNAEHGLTGGTLFTDGKQDYSNCTMFPHVIGMAASFNRQLWYDMSSATSDEARAFANVGRAGLDWFGPNINGFRDPRWGRGQEVPGEDPYLSAEYAIQFVKGLQEGEDKRYFKTVADCKHLAGYDVDRWEGYDRSSYDAKISAIDLVESYLPPFEACVNQANVGSIMCSYNAVNGVPSCANQFFLQTILRERFHFDESAFVVSDCGAIEELYTTHKYSKSPPEAVAQALKAGVDINCGSYYSEHGMEAYKANLINDEDLNQALMRQFLTLLRVGYFDSAESQPYRQYGIEKINSPHNQQLALTAGLQSIVLLKNEAKTLPYPASSINSIALIGPYGNATDSLIGSYASPAPYIISIEQALSQRSAKVTRVAGCTGICNETSDFDAAVKAASEADLVLYAGGNDQSIEAEVHDRTTIDLPGQQNALIKAIATAAKKPIIAVIFGGGQCDLSALKSNKQVGAILWAGYPGQSGGEAVVRVLTGEHSPSARLPSTQYPADYVNQVPMTDQSYRPSATSPGRTYKFYTGEAVYPFGHGLSYTTFDYKVVGESVKSLPMSALLSSSPIAYYVNVTNTGSVTSDVTVLAYLTFNASADFPSLSPPIRQLFDFQFVPQLKAGQTVQIFFQLTSKAMRQVDENGHEWLVPGTYEVHINDGQARQMVQVEGEVTLARKWEGSDIVEEPKRASFIETLARKVRSWIW